MVLSNLPMLEVLSDIFFLFATVVKVVILMAMNLRALAVELDDHCCFVSSSVDRFTLQWLVQCSVF